MNAKVSAATRQGFLALCIAFASSSCSLEPRYTIPVVPAPASFKEESALTPQEAGTWQKAVPAEGVERGEWWKIFHDARLDGYEERALSANQSLQAAAARVKEARSLLRVARSDEFPSVGTGFGPVRQLYSPSSLGVAPGTVTSPQNVWRAQASVSYEADLFGRVSSGVHAARAETEQSEALFRSVQLALEGDVAQNYFNLCELDAELDVVTKTLGLRREALDFVSNRLAAGDVSELDVAQAKSELETAHSDAMTLQRQRAAAEHSLAVLLGVPPAELSISSNPMLPQAIKIPPGLSSTLLERRPDISAAERAMAAANARIGVAKAAFFPSLTLTGEGGYESSKLGNLFNWSNRSFLLGPLVGTPFNLPIFDGGLRRGNLANARAKYEEEVALYRQQVLVAFREVEDSLANVRILDDQTQVENLAVTASARAAKISRTQYDDGAIAYIDVIETERSLLQDRRNAVQLEAAQAVSTVNLIRALGGGWGNTTNIYRTPDHAELSARSAGALASSTELESGILTR